MDIGDLATPGLMIAGVVTGVGTAAVALYSNFRSAKYEADRREDELLAGKLKAAQARIEDLERDLGRRRGAR